VDTRDEKERALYVMQELAARRANDPLNNFKAHEKQKRFIDSVLMGVKNENWFIAANRSGKSDAGAYCGASLARFGSNDARSAYALGMEVKDRATSGWVSALDFPTSRDAIQPKYFDNGFVPAGQAHPPFIPKHEVDEWRVADQILKLKNGSIIGFKSADSGRRKYQGSEKDWIHFDEEHPWEIYEESVIRVGSRALSFFCTATILPPEGMASGTVSWVFPKIIQPFLDGRDKSRGVFGASIYDNPGIPRDEIRRLESIYPEGSMSRRIRLGGEWLPGIGGSRAYHTFDRAIHAKTAPEVSPYRPLVWVWDFNVEPMVSLVCQRVGDIFWVLRELTLEEASIPDMCDMFKMHFPDHPAEIWLYGDATANKRTSQTGKTDYFIVLNEMRSYGTGVKMKVPPENPKIADRINAVNHLLKDETGQVRLFIDTSCQELISDLEGVLRDFKGGIQKTYNRKDPYFRRTHWSDALGYWIGYEEPVRPPSMARMQTLKIPAPSYSFSRVAG
jgi:phage terminase large subunit-like protein